MGANLQRIGLQAPVESGANHFDIAGYFCVVELHSLEASLALLSRSHEQGGSNLQRLSLEIPVETVSVNDAIATDCYALHFQVAVQSRAAHVEIAGNL